MCEKVGSVGGNGRKMKRAKVAVTHVAWYC